jgi:hypothetical protein
MRNYGGILLSKFSYILLGLVATFSSFVVFTVHLGTTQAFVSATTNINLDFGRTIFPGEVVTDSFTLVDSDKNDTVFPVDYKLTLVPNTTPDEDLSIYLYIEKASEPDSEVDGWLDGRPTPPDLEGQGSFISADDNDTWNVTIQVPDDPADGGRDYSCEIRIEPIVDTGSG